MAANTTPTIKKCRKKAPHLALYRECASAPSTPFEHKKESDALEALAKYAEQVAKSYVPTIFSDSYVISALALVVPLFSITRGTQGGEEVDETWESKNRGCVRYRGPRLTQSHQSLLLVLLKLCSEKCLYNTIELHVTPRTLLKELGWSDSKARRARLIELLDDLQKARLRVWACGQDEQAEAERCTLLTRFKPSTDGTWALEINPSALNLLFGPRTVLKLDVRNKLREGLATFIYGYVEANTGVLKNGNRVRYSFRMLHELSGSTAKDLGEFSDSVCSALDQLVNLGAIEKYERIRAADNEGRGAVIVYKNKKS